MTSNLDIILIVLVILLAILCLYLLFFKKCNGGKNNPKLRGNTGGTPLLQGNTGGTLQCIPFASHEWNFTNKSGTIVPDTGIGKTEKTSITLNGGCRLDGVMGLVLDGQIGSYADSGLEYDICDPVSFEILFKYENRNIMAGVFSFGRLSKDSTIYDTEGASAFINLRPSDRYEESPGRTAGHLTFQYSESEHKYPSPWNRRGGVVTDQPVIDYGDWMSVVITIGSNGVKIYKNGELIKHDPHVPGAQDGLGPPNAMEPPSRDFWDCEIERPSDLKRWLQLGKGHPLLPSSIDDSEYYMKGAIKHFRIWKNTELTESMVSKLY